jgi:uncharacterized protein HemX
MTENIDKQPSNTGPLWGIVIILGAILFLLIFGGAYYYLQQQKAQQAQAQAQKALQNQQAQTQAQQEANQQGLQNCIALVNHQYNSVAVSSSSFYAVEKQDALDKCKASWSN